MVRSKKMHNIKSTDNFLTCRYIRNLDAALGGYTPRIHDPARGREPHIAGLEVQGGDPGVPGDGARQEAVGQAEEQGDQVREMSL